jgi:thioredoxin-related protein
LRRTFVLLGILFSAFIFAFHTYSSTETAFNLARIEEKKLIYIFESKTCYYCKMLNLKTLTDPTVRKILDINYRVVIIYYQEKPDMFYEFRVRGTPTMWFFETDSEKPKPITYLPGYVPPDIFVKVLKYVYRLPKESFKDYVKKNDPFIGERKLIKVSEEDAEYVLKYDKDAILARNLDDFKSEENVYVTKDENLAKELLKKAYRVLLVGESG